MCMEEENTPNTAYLRYHREATNSLHPSCSAASPMETEEVRTVTWREERGQGDRDRAQRETRRDRERRGMPREERHDRNRRERDQERERGANRRQRDRGDRAHMARYQGPTRPRK